MDKRTLAALLLSPLLASSLYAANHFYVNGGVGAVFPSKNSSYSQYSNSILYGPTVPGVSLFSLPYSNWKTNYNTGYDANLAVGYQFTNHWRSEVEFIYQNMQRDMSGNYAWREVNTANGDVYASSFNNPISNRSSTLNVYSFLTNAYYDFTNSTRWTPLLGGGIGFAWVTSGNTFGKSILSINDPVPPLYETAPINQLGPSFYGTAFAAQVKAGVAYTMNDKTDVSLIYRLFGTSSFKASRAHMITNEGTPDRAHFVFGEHDVNGLLTNCLELNVKYNV